MDHNSAWSTANPSNKVESATKCSSADDSCSLNGLLSSGVTTISGSVVLSIICGHKSQYAACSAKGCKSSL